MCKFEFLQKIFVKIIKINIIPLILFYTINMFSTKDDIDAYFQEHIHSMCKWKYLPEFKWLLENHYDWYMAIVNGKSWYNGFLDFLHQNNMVFFVKQPKFSTSYDPSLSLEEYFFQKIVPIMDNGKLPSLEELKEQWHLGWYTRVASKIGVKKFKHLHSAYFR